MRSPGWSSLRTNGGLATLVLVAADRIHCVASPVYLTTIVAIKKECGSNISILALPAFGRLSTALDSLAKSTGVHLEIVDPLLV